MVVEDHDRPLGGRDLLGLGAMLVGAVVGCTALGLLLDHLAGSAPVGVLLGVAAGIAFGAIGFVLRVRRALRVPSEHDPRGEVRP
jgi:F0F1-type ATP synthase assembly protein I